jgi:hypothetical protein
LCRKCKLLMLLLLMMMMTSCVCFHACVIAMCCYADPMQSELEVASKGRREAEGALGELREVYGKLEATAAALRASQEATARELVEQQVGGLHVSWGRVSVCGYVACVLICRFENSTSHRTRTHQYVAHNTHFPPLLPPQPQPPTHPVL